MIFLNAVPGKVFVLFNIYHQLYVTETHIKCIKKLEQTKKEKFCIFGNYQQHVAATFPSITIVNA